MTQPLTQQQIADLKTNTLNGCETDHFKTDETILSLIATLEARDAAFNEMLDVCLQVIEANKSPTMPDMFGKMAKLVSDAYKAVELAAPNEARSAIAHAEKVK